MLKRTSRHTGFGIALEAQHNLRGTVPSRGYVFRHISGVLLRVDRETTGQTEITNLELAVCVDQQVSGFQITMQDVCGVDVLQSAKDLVDKRLEVSVGKGLAGTDDGSKIALHQFCVEIPC